MKKIFSVLGLLFIVLNIANIVFYLKLPVIGGWDGQGHASAGIYYAKHIFPSAWGWIPSWSGGMPFPQFYPPLFFFIVALLSKILFFIPYDVVFKLFVVILQTLLPIITAWVALSITKDKRVAWLSGFITLILSSLSFSSLTNYGLALTATFNSGFIQQLLGFIFLLCWIRYFFEIEESIKARYLSLFFLWCILLTNAHIVPIAGLYFLVTFIVKGRHRPLPYLLSGLIPFLLGAFWYMPLIKYYSYLLTMPLTIDTVWVLKHSWYIGLFVIISFVLSIKNKQKNILIISLVNVLIICISLLKIDELFPSLPLHSARWIAEYYFLSLILISFVLNEVIKLLPHNKQKLAFIFIVVLGIGLFFITGSFKVNKGGMYTTSEADHMTEMLNYLKGKQGKIMLESYLPGEPVSLLLVSKLGEQDNQTLTFTLRESSISTQFLVPVRNSLSLDKESWGFESYKTFNKTFLNRPFEESLSRAISLDVHYFLIRTPYEQNKFDKGPLVQLEKDFGNWKLYSTKDTASRAVTILPYQPVLLYAPINFKGRKENDYNYSRLQEELFLGKKRDYILVEANDVHIDTSTDLEKFSTAVISDYKYTNIDKAFTKLEKYSQTNQLVLLYTKDPLFDKLMKINDSNHHIFIAPRTIKPDTSNPLVVQNDIQSLLDRLESIKIPVVTPKEASVTEDNISPTNYKVDITNSDTQILPILINQSYFPAWKRKDSQDTYLATPTFTFTFATSTFEMDFEKDSSVTLGELISLLTLIGVVLSAFFQSKISKEAKTD